MTDSTFKIENEANLDSISSFKESEVEKIFKAIQKNIETNPQFKAQFQNLLLGSNIKSSQFDTPLTKENDLRVESSKNKMNCENFSYEDFDSSSSSDKKECSENGKTTLADKVKHDLANINSKLIKKKSITKKRWWTPEEVFVFKFS